jgi:hypothetical protein
MIKRQDGKLTIAYRKFRATTSGPEEQREEMALDYTREGIINAVLKGSRKSSRRINRTSAPKKISNSPDQLRLF